MRSTLAAAAFLAGLTLTGCAALPPAPGPAWRCWEASRGLLTCERSAP